MGVFYYSSDYNYRYGPPTRTEYRLVVENLSSRISWQVRSDRDVLGPSSSHHLPSTQGPGRFTLLEGSAGHREADGTMALWGTHHPWSTETEWLQQAFLKTGTKLARDDTGPPVQTEMKERSDLKKKDKIWDKTLNKTNSAEDEPHHPCLWTTADARAPHLLALLIKSKHKQIIVKQLVSLPL